MPRKIKKSSLITQPMGTPDDIPQIITATALEYFPLLKKADVDLYLQIALLKGYAEKYYYLGNDFNHDNNAMEVIKNNPKFANSVTQFLKEFHGLCSKQVFASKEEQQTRFKKKRIRDLTEVDSDKVIDFGKSVNLYASFINIKSAISGLDDEKNALNATKRIYVLFNQALPYYPSEIRNCFDLEQLFVKFERIRKPFFDNVTLLFSDRLAAKNSEFLFLKQAQLHVLCAAMMWINHAKITNAEFDSTIFFVLDILSNLLPNRLNDLMFMDYFLEETDVIVLLPSPLNMIAVLIEHYQNKKNQSSEENEKLDNLLSTLQTIKQRFMDKFKGNFLQDSLKQEFILFLDKLLQVVLHTNETGYRPKILEYYHSFLPLMDQLIKLFELSSQSDPLHLLTSTKTKWDNFINENDLAYQMSVQHGSHLIHEREEIKAKFQQEQQAKAQAIHEKANESAVRMLAEKKEKELQEEAFFAMKRQERLADAQMSPLDQIQSELQRKIALELLEKNVSTDERFTIKEKISLEEICKCLKLDPTEKMDENSLTLIKDRSLALGDKLSSNERHTLLICCISLADNYLSKVTNRITYYKKNYAPSLKMMTERHGQRFNQSDHQAYQKTKSLVEPALKNLMLTSDDCECLLTTFEIIDCLRGKIEDKEFYRLWNLPAAFRKEEHKNLYKSFLENLQQLKTYRESKKNAFRKISVRKDYKKIKKNNSVKLDGIMVTKTLESLITAIKRITEILAKNDEGIRYIANVSMLKEDQLREAQLQTTVIDENKVRKPIEYNPHEFFRRSQSFHKSGIIENDLTEELNFAHSRRMSL